RRGGEQNERAQVVLVESRKEMAQAVDLRPVNALALLVGLVLDAGVGEHAGSVNQAANRTDVASNRGENTSQSRAVADIDAAIDDACSRGADAGEVLPHLAGGEDLLALFAERHRRTVPAD